MSVPDLDDRRPHAHAGYRPTPPPPSAAQNYHAALALHRHGRLREAEELYRALLNVHASDFDCLHNLGLLHAQEGRFEDAVGLLRAGARQDPRSVEVHNNLANVLAILHRHDEAIAGFRIAIALKPDFAEAHNNLGNALLTQGRTDEAIAHYRQALALRPAYADAHVNLGNILDEQDQFAAAAAHYRQALAISPRAPETHCRLGDVLKKQGNTGEAMNSYRQALALAPGLVVAHCKLGTVLLEQRDLTAATTSFERALALEPDCAEAWVGLGHALHFARRYDAALAAFAHAPALADAWIGQARALRRLHRPQEAIAAYRQALAHGGDAEVVHYYLASLGAELAPVAAPRRLVRTVFDRYCDRYDQHVVGTLKYRTPDLLLEAMARLLPPGGLDILDLGCGTGLLGTRFRARAGTLTGVDLSANMLEAARQRAIYDELLCGELGEFLQGEARQFDVAVAADVFVYLGDLSGVFGAVRARLRAGGLFGFSVEASGGEDVVLRSTLRYAHSAAYLRRLAGQHGFLVEKIGSEVLREEDGSDVRGHLAILRRA